MSLITDTWRQLVRRRLWPVAVLLLGALVAVPVLLAKSPAPSPAAPEPAKQGAAPAGGGLSEPIVAMADDASAGRRHVLGPRKDPFTPAPQPNASPTATPSSRTGGTITTQTGSRITISGGTGTTGLSNGGSLGSTGSGSGGAVTPVSSGGGVSPSFPTTPTTPTTPSTPAAHPKKLAPGTLTVRWGDASSDTLDKLTVKRLDALPDADHPVAIYLGPGKAKNTAVFLVDASVTPEGDGSCRPSDADCERVVIHKGDTEFFTVDDTSGTSTDATSSGTQYELQLADIAGGGKAKASRARSSRASWRAHASHARVTIARVVRLLHP